MEIPVYLFTGFLESGKTHMIHETLADKRFQNKERTLVLLCEEGEEEYDTSAYKGNVFIEKIELPSELNTDNLLSLFRKHKAERVMVEYNGMWMIKLLYDALPEEWFVYQEVMCVDSTTFKTYNANMRSLMYDKFQGCSVVFYNRCTDETDIMELHSAARAVSRSVGIVYEYTDGRIKQDDIEDPLPFDLDAPLVEIEDRDYAIWYRDMAESMETGGKSPRYEGKLFKVKGFVLPDKSLPKNSFAFGRMVMTCCAEDISFHGMIAVSDKNEDYKQGTWLILTARLNFEKTKLYRGYGPVFHIISAEKTDAPDDPVATFQ